MSVVVVRDGVIAADSRGVGGGLKTKMRKLLRQGDVAIGWTGNFIDGKAFADWYFAGADLDNPPVGHNREGKDNEVVFAALVLCPDGWAQWFSWMVPETDQDLLMPYYAIGSGSHAAMAAMHMGADAIKAVEVACAVIDGCALPVVHESIGQTKKLERN